ncbi:MAG: hypothetical protein Tsb0020_44080 [Haliangiales bacterium]
MSDPEHKPDSKATANAAVGADDALRWRGAASPALGERVDPARSPVSAGATSQSVWDEPHLRPGRHRPDPSEFTAARSRPPSRDQLVDHSVWDEPALDPARRRQRPKDALTYRRWLDEKRAETSAGRSWLVTLACVLAAGPLAILGTFAQSASAAAAGWSMLVAVAIIGPLTEEVMKIALPLWVAERRPYLFRSRAQIALCALASGFVFAAIENILYLHVYVPDPSPGLVAWRWSVCVALHMGCALIAGLGVMRAWALAEVADARSRLKSATPLLITAVVIHGSYNALAVLVELARFRF